DPHERVLVRASHRLTRLVRVRLAEERVRLATLSPASEPARAQRLKQAQLTRETRLVATLRPREERRVVQAPALTVEPVRVDDEPRILIPMDDRLPLNIARAVHDKRLDPPESEPAERPIPIKTRSSDQLAGHVNLP